jgi:hypothetical protein
MKEFSKEDYTIDEWVDLVDELLDEPTYDVVPSIVIREFSSFKEECYNAKGLRVKIKDV